jgi:hypothetical protein
MIMGGRWVGGEEEEEDKLGGGGQGWAGWGSPDGAGGWGAISVYRNMAPSIVSKVGNNTTTSQPPAFAVCVAVPI